ncbi:MAG: hypothetical protein IMZ51_03855 [Chloroflexi bacterium]|nr:hypothetical protein [Chloroflexota bacterium]
MIHTDTQTTKKIKVVVMLIVLQIPFLVLSVAGHELIHKFDYRSIDKVSESFCFIDCEGGLAYYTFIPVEDMRAKAIIIQQTTELRAWGFTILMMVLYLIISIYFLLIERGFKTK